MEKQLMKIFPYIIAIVMFAPQLSAQTPVDSLTTTLANSSGRQRVNDLNSLTEHFLNRDAEKARQYSMEARELSVELGYTTGEALALSNLGELYRIAGESQEAIDIQLKALEIVNHDRNISITGIINNRLSFAYRTQGRYKDSIAAAREAYDVLIRLGDSVEASFALNMIGYGYWRTGVYDSSLVYYKNALKLRETVGDKMLVARTYNNIGVVHYQLADYERALESYLKSLHLREELNDKEGISIVLTNIGKTYQDWGNTDEAMEYFKRSYDTAVEIDDKRAIAYVLNNIGAVHELKGDYEAALGYYEKSLELYRSGETGGIILNLNCIATVHNHLGNYDTAREYAVQAYEEAERTGSIEGQASAYRNIGISYQLQNNNDKALDYLTRSLKLSIGITQRDLTRENYNTISDIYEVMDDYKNSLHYYRRYEALHDSLFSEEAAQFIDHLKNVYETERAERENEVLRNEKLAQDIILRRNRIIIVLISISLVSIIALSFIQYLAYRHKQKANLLLQEKNREISEQRDSIEHQKSELENAMSHIKVLSGLIPICSHCKKIRDDEGYWKQIESYITEHSDAEFSHGICPECQSKYYAEFYHGSQANGKIKS